MIYRRIKKKTKKQKEFRQKETSREATKERSAFVSRTNKSSDRRFPLWHPDSLDGYRSNSLKFLVNRASFLWFIKSSSWQELIVIRLWGITLSRTGERFHEHESRAWPIIAKLMKPFFLKKRGWARERRIDGYFADLLLVSQLHPSQRFTPYLASSFFFPPLSVQACHFFSVKFSACFIFLRRKITDLFFDVLDIIFL